MLSKKLAAVAALSLMTASTVAQAQSAQSSVASAPRAGAEVQGANQMEGGATIWIVGAIVLGLAIWGIIELTDDDNSESP